MLNLPPLVSALRQDGLTLCDGFLDEGGGLGGGGVGGIFGVFMNFFVKSEFFAGFGAPEPLDVV